MSVGPELEKIVSEGTRRLLARAGETYSLNSDLLRPRIGQVVEKYFRKAAPEVSSPEIIAFIDELQADELCLIVACEHGDQNAWNDLVDRFSATVRSAARSSSANEDAAEDLAQSIWAELHGLRARADGKPAGKLGYYSGRGSLAGWLRAVVAQLAVDQHRKQSRLVQTEEDEDFDRLSAAEQPNPASSINLEQSIANKFVGAELQKALANAVAELADEDRLLVKLYYFDGLKLREAGKMLGVHEATASRRLTRIHADLRKKVEECLSGQGWEGKEIERAFAEVAVHLTTDIEALVSSTDGR